MKSKKLSIAIVSTFIAALGLAACSNVTAKDKSVVTLTGFDNKEISVDEIYKNYKTSNEGINAFYDAILEAMIRNYYVTKDENKLHEFEEKAKNDVQSEKDKASENAKNNPDSNYDAEWESILKSKNCKDEKELLEKFIYEYEKKDYQDKYFKDHRDELTQEYTGTAKGKHEAMYPYHVRHILVKTTASATDYVTGEITEDEARKLAAVYTELKDGKDFGDIAVRLSEDEGSAAKFGDSGIMTTATSFVNEFKLGLYAYDAVYGKAVTGDATKKDNVLGINNEVRDELNSFKLGQVPFEVFEFLGDNANTTRDENNNILNEGVAKYYPRNIMWNSYLNKHNVFVVTDDTLKSTVNTEDATRAKENVNFDLGYTVEDAKPGKSGFRRIPLLDTELGGAKRVLTDEQGRVVIGVRSEFGIHFMIMHRTPFELDGTITGVNYAADGTLNYTRSDVDLNEYYTTYKPGDSKYPKDGDKDAITYVNFLNAEKSTLTARAKEVEDQIKSFDPMYDYRMFEELMSNGQIEIKDTDVKDEIVALIQNKRDYNKWNDQKTLNESWKAYLDKIALQMETRGDKDGLDESKRLVRVTCAINMKHHNDANAKSLWEKGGACYYEK